MTAVDHAELKRLADELREASSGRGHAIWERGCQSCAMDSNVMDKSADALEALLSEIEGLKAERDALSSRNVEAARLAYDWMAAHDSLKAGQPYDLPSPSRTQAPDSWRPDREEVARVIVEWNADTDFHFQALELADAILALRPQTAESGK